MQDAEIRKAFGARLKELRKHRHWSQKELAEKLDIRFSHLNKYESGMHMPPVEKLMALAALFDTSIDFLITGNETNDQKLHNTRLLKRFEAVQALSSDDQDTIVAVLDAMIVKHRVQGAVQPVDRPRKTATG